MKISKKLLIYCENKEEYKVKFGDIRYRDTSNITNMNSMFCDTTTFNSDLSGWVVRNVVDPRFMFEGASSFDQARYSPKFTIIWRTLISMVSRF